MKKRILIFMLASAMALSAAGCGEGENNNAAPTTETAERTTLPAKASVDMEIDYEKQVKKLCDYKNVPVTITGQYEVKDADMEQILLSDLKACYADLEEVKDRDTIKDTDVAKVDYTGYRDGKKFDGGSAKDAYVAMGDGNGFIDGFTKDLPGAKIGDKVETKVTFPEDYSSAELAGKDAVFKFKVKGIYKRITDLKTLRKMAKNKKSLVNTNVAATFSAYGITDFASLEKYEKEYVKRSLSNQKYSDTVAAIKEYMTKNCEVEIPQDYLDARVTEYQVTFEKNSLSSGQSLEDYLKANGQTLEETKKNWTADVEQAIKTEFIFGLIAQKENIKLDEDEFKKFIDNIVAQSSQSSSSASAGTQFKTAEELYSYYGAGNAENGEKYMKQLFIMNKAIDVVYNQAKVTVKEEKKQDAQTEDTETKKQ